MLKGRILNSISGQITLLVLFSLLLVLIVNLTVVYFFFDAAVDRRASVPPGARFTQMSMLVRLADEETTEAGLTELLDKARRAGFDFIRITELETKSIASIPSPPSPRSPFRMGPGRGPFEGIDPTRVLRGQPERVVIQLKDGSGLAFLAPARPNAGALGFFMSPLMNVLVLIVILIVGLSIYAVRSITSPLSSFAAIAQSIGKGAYGKSVREKGPQEVVKAARALNEMRDRIRTMIDDRTSMLYAISHDLRTPLTRLRLRAEKLPSDQADGLLNDINRMERMLSETLHFLRGDALSENEVPTDLVSVLETICTEMSDLGKDVRYYGPSKLVYVCHPSAISRAITNLVENALKYGTHAEVKLAATTDEIIIDVSDDGPGIPYSYRSQIFEPFFKLDLARNSEINPGFGLGLSITRRVIDAHGGQIELLDRVPRGTKVRITLPTTAQRDHANAVGRGVTTA